MSQPTRERSVLHHVLLDGTHEIRFGLLLLLGAGCWLAERSGALAGRTPLAIAVGVAILLAAGPGVTRLRSTVVIPRLGYARPALGHGAVAFVVFGVVVPVVALTQLDAIGILPKGALVAVFVLPVAMAVLARRSGLGRHYGVAATLLATAIILTFGGLPPWDTVASQLVAMGFLLVTAGSAALSRIIADYPVVNDREGDDGQR